MNKTHTKSYFKEQNENDNNLITIKVHEHMTCLTLFLWLLEFVVSAPSGEIAIFGPHCLECRWKMSFFSVFLHLLNGCGRNVSIERVWYGCGGFFFSSPFVEGKGRQVKKIQGNVEDIGRIYWTHPSSYTNLGH